MGLGGFSWRRALGISAAQARLSRKIGIPLSRSGRQQKIGRMVTGGGCLVVAAVHAALFAALVMAACKNTSSNDGAPFAPGSDATGTSGATAISLSAADRAFCVTIQNQARAAVGSGPLAEDAGLMTFAATGALEDLQLQSAHHHLSNNPPAATTGENEAVVELTPGDSVQIAFRQAVTLWLNEGPSGGHFQNLLNGRWTKIGCGAARSSLDVQITVDYQ